MKNKVILRFIIPPALIISFAIYVIFSLSTKNSSPPSQSGWVLQTNLQTQLRGRTVSDMTFTDSLTGYAVTYCLNYGDTGFIMKTTNGGDNWFVSFAKSKYFEKIKFVNDSIGFACGGSGGGFAYFCKTTNCGNSWIGFEHSASYYKGMSVLNKDTIYLADPDVLVGGVFRSANGGANWEHLTSGEPDNIYMYNSRIGFYNNGYLKKTTDGGYNWTQINSYGFIDIRFIDSLVGYRICYDSNYASIQKTTNGGYNWIRQTLPNVPGGTCINDNRKLFFINKDTIWAVGPYMEYGPNPYRYRGLLYKTTNGGFKWGYQLPDTHIVQNYRYNLINFYRNQYGWAYMTNGKGVHTITGGDTTFYSGIAPQNQIINEFKLYQNFPNPFNSVTNIEYQIANNKFILLKVFNILGKEVSILVNEKKSKGSYKVKFDGNNLSTGIYFYSLFIDGDRVDTKKFVLLK